MVMKEAWTTGITVLNNEDGWAAECKWEMGKFGESGRMEGKIQTVYYEPTLAQAIDYVLDTMKLFGVIRSDEIEIMKDELGFGLYTDDETEQTEGAFKQLKDEANKRGWKSYV